MTETCDVNKKLKNKILELKSKISDFKLDIYRIKYLIKHGKNEGS